MTHDADATLRRENHERRIDCPISWCTGRWIEHGGYGEEPDQWVHTGAMVRFPAIDDLPESQAFIERIRFGSGTDGWNGQVKVGDGAFETGLPTVVLALREVASQIAAIIATEESR